jgi:antirestriction protein
MEQPPDTNNPDDSGNPAAQREQEPQPRPRIYVASLADYNAGRLHGAWLDADRDRDELEADIAAMLAASREPIAEDWAIHDYDGFGPLRLSEYENLDTVSRLANGIAEHGPAFAAWASLVGTDPEDLAKFEEGYLGRWESVTDYARHLFDDLGFTEVLDQLIPPYLQPYVHVDYDAVSRDLTYGGDVTAVDSPDGGVWLFNADG